MAPVTQQRRFGFVQRWQWLGAWLFLVFGFAAFGSELEEARRLLMAGQYNECAGQAEKVVATRPEDEPWQLLLSRSLLATGKYREARSAMTNALARDPKSLALRWQAREVFQSNGDTEAASQMVEEIIQRGTGRAWMYRDDAASLVAIGQALLLRGIDPKSVLDAVFANARKVDPKLRELYLASGQLALDEHDFALAAKKFEEGLKQLPDDPELQCGLAQAYAPSAPAAMLGALESALEKNSNHVGCLLLMIDHDIDAEDYAEAEEKLERIKAINPWQPEAWAYRAVLAHLKNQAPAEESARANALKFWPDNPQVDYLIGKKLSQNYRFAEGASHQRQALQYDSDYLPAKAQLAEDLLRLGQEAEGWKLAQEVQKRDGYDVQAYNLVGLHEKMSTFSTLTNSDFLVRMTRHEAAVYGQQVLQLLGQARSNLCAKFGIELQRPTIVEIFADQKDFAVRTFGMPGNPGYLGVCFGRVVTANSPASQASHSVNWRAVLWHEFCHVVTLQLTANKMPRWLSEGISVYEEIQANPSWGQTMNPQYREMVLGDDLTPLSELSAAFLSPRSDLHLQFAYFEASLVVEFLVQRFGLDSLKAVLGDLGQGVEIHKALEDHTVAMAKLDEEFAAFARERANNLAPGLDFEKPTFAKQESATGEGKGQERPQRLRASLGPGGGESWDAWAKDHPTNFWALALRGQELVEAKKWAEAKPVLQRLLELYPTFAGPDSAYRLLAAAHRALGETNLEKQVLARFAALDKEATDAYLRLMELDAAAQEWPAVFENAQRYLAVNPLVAPPYRFLAQASEAAGDLPSAATAYRALLELEPSDPAEAHFHLARILHRLDDPAARRQVLQALEEAPRYRAALELLLEIERGSPQSKFEQGTATAQASP
jgi:tetratricopeptide (TPR) repeat protein